VQPSRNVAVMAAEDSTAAVDFTGAEDSGVEEAFAAAAPTSVLPERDLELALGEAALTMASEEVFAGDFGTASAEGFVISDDFGAVGAGAGGSI
jgi:hypothetical protein